MTVPVRECSPRYDAAVGSQRIPADAIRWEDGQSFLYAIQEGQGLTARPVGKTRPGERHRHRGRFRLCHGG